MEFYNIKDEEKFSYKHTIGNQMQYTYSQELVDFIVREIGKNPEGFVESLKHKKSNPRHM